MPITKLVKTSPKSNSKKAVVSGTRLNFKSRKIKATLAVGNNCLRIKLYQYKRKKFNIKESGLPMTTLYKY